MVHPGVASCCRLRVPVVSEATAAQRSWRGRRPALPRTVLNHREQAGAVPVLDLLGVPVQQSEGDLQAARQLAFGESPRRSGSTAESQPGFARSEA